MLHTIEIAPSGVDGAICLALEGPHAAALVYRRYLPILNGYPEILLRN